MFSLCFISKVKLVLTTSGTTQFNINSDGGDDDDKAFSIFS